MKISQSLSDAIGDAFDARAKLNSLWGRVVRIKGKNSALVAVGAQAAARLAEVDREIEQLTGVLLEDDALAGIADEERLTAVERADAERRLGALHAERDGLPAKIQQSAAGAAALMKKAATREPDVIESLANSKAAWSSVVAAVWRELQTDLAHMAMPLFLTKHYCIALGRPSLGSPSASMSYGLLACARSWDSASIMT